jgi:hypothetical protein
MSGLYPVRLLTTPPGSGPVMAGLDIDTVLRWRGRTVRDPDGEKIGTFGDIYLDRETDRPAWAGIRTGLFGTRESYVPLNGMTEEEGDLRVPFSRDLVKDAPQIDPDVALDRDEEERLYAHYRQEYAQLGEETEETEETAPSGDEGATMIRSEEEVTAAHGPMRPAERVRLKKVLVTDEVTRTIPVRREVVQLEHEPPPEGDVESVEDAGPQEGHRPASP